ncbi:MAG: polysaccharide lyase [Treponema sp.]|nr:polysaccharide lyase [Treponema sp.]
MIKIFYVILLIFLSSCLQPDAPETESPRLEIRETKIYAPLLHVLVIDPDETITVSLYNDYFLSDTKITDAAFSSGSPSIQVVKNGSDFEISGKAGVMGIVKFESAQRSGELRVFVRNWKAADVSRNILSANMNVYNEDFAVPYNARGQTSYRLIRDRGFHYEAPDGLSARQTNLVSFEDTIHGDNYLETELRKLHEGVPHVVQVKDWEYLPEEAFRLHREVFRFIMHHELDGDMVGGYDDRQRMEIKTMDGQHDNPDMHSRGNGDTFTHRWKFRLPDDFRVSSEFTHIHQLKPEGGDSGNPTFTLTGRRLRTGREVLQLIYRGPIRPNGDPSVNWYPAEVDLAPFKGEWIFAQETVTYDNPGTFSIKLVRIRDMKVLMEYTYSPAIYNEPDPFVMYRPFNSYIRPKFGVYRRILHMTPFGLPDPANPVLTFLGEEKNERGEREMAVLFADFEMDKLIR